MSRFADYASAALLILTVELTAALGRMHLTWSRRVTAARQFGLRPLTVPVENGRTKAWS
ncbi:MAG TPA: hypothetical protein VHN20_05615 [Beijerinckiaceae bacterium]|nr:hypothetical protein [Beijerinckiaceae bacterium]